MRSRAPPVWAGCRNGGREGQTVVCCACKSTLLASRQSLFDKDVLLACWRRARKGMGLGIFAHDSACRQSSTAMCDWQETQPLPQFLQLTYPLTFSTLYNAFNSGSQSLQSCPGMSDSAPNWLAHPTQSTASTCNCISSVEATSGVKPAGTWCV
jgi:hypothetical protein